MANLLGCITTSHIPSIGNAIEKDLYDDPYWKPFFDSFPPIHDWVDAQRPDVAIVVYNDHGLNFFLDNMPTFAIGAAHEYTNADEGWGLKPVAPFAGDPELSWHIIESLVADEFDVATCQEMLVDHGFTVPMSLVWPDRATRPIKVIPVAVNTVQHPVATPARCLKLGKAIGKAVESYDKDLKVVILGTGGLSHQLDGERAGFINNEFDLMCVATMVSAPEDLTTYSIHDLVRLAGSQGVEVIMWMIARGALLGDVRELYSNYHIPISNTAAGVMLLENS